MNSGYNAPLYHIPVMAVESLCQQSMYQQHTYVDRTRMAVTDVFVQEHVSQSSWTMSTPVIPIRSPVFIQTGRGPYMGGNAAPPPAPHPHVPPPPPPHYPSMHGRYAYMSMPGVQYYAASSASMNSFGQMYMQHSATSSTNVSGIYVPHYHPTHSTPRPHHYTKDNACQTRSYVKRSCDAQTQTDLIGDAPPIVKFKYQANLIDSSNQSSISRNVFESNGFSSIQQGDRRNSEVILPIQRLQEITRISLKGSDIAERLANAHRQRPCFKKMDTLCARLKQDLLRPDGVLPNINSQGIAWAVKDFIFVFTRIVNSWLILKGYVYNTPDGLNKIKDELPSGFMAAFDNWQISTFTIVEMIIKSFVNLDGMLQKQKNSFSKLDISNNCNANANGNGSGSSSGSGNGSGNGNGNGSGSGTSSGNSNDNSSDSNSSNKTLNGTEIPLPLNATVHLTNDHVRGPGAFSTPYNSKKSDHTADATVTNSFNEPPMQAQDTPPRGGRSKSDLSYIYTMIQDSEEAQRCVNANGTYLKTGTYTPLKKDANASSPPTPPPHQNIPNSWRSMAQPSNARQQALQQHQHLQQNHNQHQHQQTVTLEQLRSGLKNQTPKLKTPLCRHNDAKSYAALMNREMSRRLYELSNRIMQLQNIDRFFQKQFTRNYYPYFFERCQHEFIDVRAIILKCESATYQHIYQAIHDMRRIIYLVRSDLKDHTNMDLRLYTALYERSINEMLAKTPYHPQQFEHITGEPGEKLFN